MAARGLIFATLVVAGSLCPSRACTQVNFTGVYVVGSSDIHPFDHDIPSTAGALSSRACESVQQAFDGDSSTKWVQGDFDGNTTNDSAASNTAVTLRLQTIPCLTKYTITSANDAPGRDPAEWTLSGSSDGTTWEVLDYEVGVEFSKRQETMEFPITFSRHFNWFRFDFLAVRDAASGGNMIQFSDVGFFTGDCTDHSEIWYAFSSRVITASFHTLVSDTTSFLSLEECKTQCEAHNTTEDYYRDYQCSAITYRPKWRKYGVDHSSECNLIHYWGEPQLARSSTHSFYTRDLGDCHDGVLMEESCYRLSEDFEGNVTWAEASADCEAWGGYLAVFEDEAEATSIARTVRPLRDDRRWVGLSTFGDCTGTYHWSNYAEVNISASYLGFVTTTSTDIEADAHCVSLHNNNNWHFGKKFEDRACVEELPFICEKDMPKTSEDLDAFTCPGHTVCNGVGQFVVTAGNWENNTVCGCRDGFVATGQGVECECGEGTFLAQVEGTSGDANTYCATPRSCNKWGQFLISESTPMSDVVCGCLSNVTGNCDPDA